MSSLAPILAVLLASAGDLPASSDVLALELEPDEASLWARAGLAADKEKTVLAEWHAKSGK